jgi:hypothetical protein
MDARFQHRVHALERWMIELPKAPAHDRFGAGYSEGGRIIAEILADDPGQQDRISTSAQSRPLCLKMDVVSEPDLKMKPVASSTLSNANKICSPSTATIGRSDIMIFSPILPVNIRDWVQAITVRGAPGRLVGELSERGASV